ncbi:MAG: SpoIIE family protein phosphatase [Clostridia bacterium]|nr:SpoIIE family protein phosphatase [Clostridia bacterium]
MDVSKIKKTQAEGIASIIKNLEVVLENKFVSTIIKPLLWLISALALSSTEAIIGVTPFGVSLVCAANGFICTSAAMCGAVLGSASLGQSGLWQIFVCTGAYVVRLAVSFIEKRKNFTLDKAFTEKTPMRILTAAIASIAAGSATVLYGGNMYLDIFSAVSGFALYPAFTYALCLLLSKKEKQNARVSGLCAAIYAIALTLQSWHLPFNAGAVFTLAATLVFTYTNGALQGAAVGIFGGMALEAAYAPMFPLAAFTAGLINKYSASGAVICSGAVAMCWAFRVSGFGAMGDLLAEILFTSAALAPIANMGIFPKREFFQPQKEFVLPQSPPNRMLEEKMGKLSLSLDEISDLLTEVSHKVQRPTSQEAERICASAKAKFCRSCVHYNICTGVEKNETNRFFHTLQSTLEESGGAGAGIVPQRLASRCHNIDKILDYTSTSAKITGRLAAESCKTRLFASDYKAIASLLRQSAKPDEDVWERDSEKEIALINSFSNMGVDITGVSVYGKRCRKIYFRGIGMPNAAGEDDIRRESEKIVGGRLSSPDFTIDGKCVSAYMHTVPRFSIESGKYSSAGKKDNFSGDTVCSFNNDEGYYYSLVSDGMGSGKEAALTSGISAVFLEKLLLAGAPMKSTLELLNAFICGGEGECFTTVDLMESDLYTGRTSFIKSGAAPSFVLRNGKVFRLHSKTVPIGIIRALDAEKITFDIMPGDMIVMLSDGVTGSYEACPWLYELLEGKNLPSLTPKEAAKVIGQAAEKATDKEDDITVAVMKVKECA